MLGVADLVSTQVHASFAQDLAERTARLLGLDQVQVGCLDPSGERIEVRAAWHAGRQLGTWSYALRDTAASAVLREGGQGIASGARDAHPLDPDLQHLEAEGFIGAPIPGLYGRPSGLISGCSSQPLARPDPLLAALRILAVHAAGVFAASANHDRLRRERRALQRMLDQAEHRQRETEARFHTMLDWTYDWEYWVRPDGSFYYMTPSAEHFTGFPSEHFLHDPDLLERIVHPDDKAIWKRHIKGSLPPRSQDIYELEFRIRHKDGRLLWVEHRCRPVIDASGDYRGRRVSISDITARKEAEEQIRSLAYFDPLTGLPNRRLLLDRLGHALAASRRTRQYGALLMIDLDHFKSLNDTQGHDVGDRLLVEVARRMTQSLRAEDTVARLGGDEYLVMLETLGTDEQNAANEAEGIAEKIRLRLKEPYPIGRADQADHYCSCSIGLSLFQGDRESVEVLLKQADVALYQAKDAGRDTIRFFNPEMQKAIESRIALETALRQALLRGELQLFYQPQIDQHGKRIGAEALLRWLHPNRGLIPPLDFIPLAEETGLIVPIGHWVVDTACAQLKEWETCATMRSLQLAVNVSARQFHQPDFVAQVRESLERSKANPARLKLELTESVVLENADSVIERMHQLRALGVSFSMDDFGTGYSSLSYLKRLPLDQLKIDKSFVRDITTDPNDAAIVRAILAMSRSLGIQVIAEGVETEEQQLFLLDNGCFAFQGYLFGKPSPIVDWRSQATQGPSRAED
ncbi:diguanylate cyclase [Imhoffiella purpurea]|uniref:cyclic-guanylate-specific phosphodiesterase n=1 Tax=Imhoffiella purpurea TaxID=1249627 RepID=W9VJU8_9GAMM|nr:diguanylate cyclase [Imhoffiella purpurea]